MAEERNLVIGNTSQLSPYFPEDFVKISSRNINYDWITSQQWNKIFICFAEQRTFLDGNDDIFFDINVSYTIDVISRIKDSCNHIIFYATTYLWNASQGAIDLSMPFNFHETPYIKSKLAITNYIKDHFRNTIILYPCNFNSPYRKTGFLFSKVFDSIINKKNIAIGETNFYRELAHPRYVVRESLTANEDKIIGPGFVTNVKEFIQDLYAACGLDFKKFVTEKTDTGKFTKKQTSYFTKKTKIDYTRDDLLRETVTELNELMQS